MSVAGTPYDDDRVLAGEYVLGLLAPDEAASFEMRLPQDADLRGLYAAWAEDFAALTDDMREVAPPASVKRAIDAGLFGAPAREGLLTRLGLGWIGGSLAAAAVAVVIALNAGLFEGPGAPADPAFVAEIAAEDRSLVVQAAYDAEDGTLYVDRAAGGAAEGRALELWLIAGDDAPISLGVLPEDPDARLAVPEALRARLAGGVLAISDEPPGGSPTGAPTGAVLAVGPITAT